MKQVKIHQTDLRASQIGFGCVALTSAGTYRAAIQLLEEGFERGITHFDTARLYGAGQSEEIVGRFMRKKRDKITITTKLGLSPSAKAMKHRRLVALGRRVLHALPTLNQFVKNADLSVSRVTVGDFDPARAAASLETSLKELQTDRIDLLLLHECVLADACNPELMFFLERQIQRGTVRFVGIGSAFDKLKYDTSLFPQLYRVLQFENSIATPRLNELPNVADRGIITHSALAPLEHLIGIGRTRPERCRLYRDRVGIDFTDSAVVAGMLLRYATKQNSESIVLFGTSKKQHLIANITALKWAENSTSDVQLSAFVQLVREDLWGSLDGPSRPASASAKSA